MPRVSVIIPTYNCAQFVCQAIDSVLDQTFTDYEIVVVDDGSTDDTKSKLEPYFDKIKYIFQKNKGLACARNTAIKNSSGELIALLDSDDLYMPMRLEKSVKIFDQDSNVGLTHGDAIYISHTGETLGPFERDTSHLSGYIWEDLIMRKSLLICPTITFRKACLSKSGLFDENLSKLGAEDRDMWIRIAQHFRVYYIPENLAYYRITPGSMSKDDGKMLQARLYLIDKYYPPGKGFNFKRRKALNSTFMKMGDWAYWDGSYRKAYDHYITAIRHYPWGFVTWYHLAKAIVKGFKSKLVVK